MLRNFVALTQTARQKRLHRRRYSASHCRNVSVPAITSLGHMHTCEGLGYDAYLGQEHFARGCFAGLLVDVGAISEPHELGAAIVAHTVAMGQPG